MATSSQHFSSFDTRQASGQHRTSNVKRSSNAFVKTSTCKFIVEQPRRTPAELSSASNLSKSPSTKVDLRSGLEECSMALNLFLSNKFTDALELLQPWAKESMYHALGYSTIVVLQAVMTFEQQDIQNGISAMKDALQTCQKYELSS
ncbi:Tetratricopeptide repeat protein 39B [Camelus dromedarius]|uniref:Tetratricopeptide repeat protein 39B n=1 Tax=Camelus dromedarius TaxID=9838 RepID=A0A5N4EA99_CAMDR|nr:Tetratricopeptide repeat protein 39B [Camelus dromedarius]